MSYRLLIEKKVYKDLDRVPSQELERIHKSMTGLEQDPYPAGVKKLKGTAGRYRIRQGDYRIVYTIDESSKVVNVLLVRHRKDVYRDLA